MATGGIEYAYISVILDHPVDRVWAYAGQFGGLSRRPKGQARCDQGQWLQTDVGQKWCAENFAAHPTWFPIDGCPQGT